MTTTATVHAREALYHGLRLTADEYHRLDDDGFRYELIEGVVCMSPSPNPRHQNVSAHITTEIGVFLKANPIGYLFVEVDVDLGPGSCGRDCVYRPDVVFLRAGPAEPIPDRITAPPDVVVEVVSPTSRRYDSETKKADYERAGVREYWLIDPEQDATTFFHLEQGRYVEMPSAGSRFVSQAIPGFALDLARLRKAFTGLR